MVNRARPGWMRFLGVWFRWGFRRCFRLFYGFVFATLWVGLVCVFFDDRCFWPGRFALGFFGFVSTCVAPFVRQLFLYHGLLDEQV